MAREWGEGGWALGCTEIYKIFSYGSDSLPRVAHKSFGKKNTFCDNHLKKNIPKISQGTLKKKALKEIYIILGCHREKRKNRCTKGNLVKGVEEEYLFKSSKLKTSIRKSKYNL